MHVIHAVTECICAIASRKKAGDETKGEPRIIQIIPTWCSGGLDLVSRVQLWSWSDSQIAQCNFKIVHIAKLCGAYVPDKEPEGYGGGAEKNEENQQQDEVTPGEYLAKLEWRGKGGEGEGAGRGAGRVYQKYM